MGSRDKKMVNSPRYSIHGSHLSHLLLGAATAAGCLGSGKSVKCRPFVLRDLQFEIFQFRSVGRSTIFIYKSIQVSSLDPDY